MEFYFELILESKNRDFTDDLIQLLPQIDKKKLRWNSHKLEVFFHALEESQLVELSERESLNGIKTTLTHLVHSTGRRKYVEEWFNDISSLENFDKEFYFKISSFKQREFLCHQIMKIPKKSIKTGILEKISWNKDLNAIKCLIEIRESFNDSEIDNLIIQEILEIL